MEGVGGDTRDIAEGGREGARRSVFIKGPLARLDNLIG